MATSSGSNAPANVAAVPVGRPAAVLDPDRSARHRFGAALRDWRMRRRLTQNDLAALVWYSTGAVGKVENATRWPSRLLALRCDTVLETGGELARLWPLVERQRIAADGRRRAHGRRSSAA
jgi:hypothetical protein